MRNNKTFKHIRSNILMCNVCVKVTSYPAAFHLYRKFMLKYINMYILYQWKVILLLLITINQCSSEESEIYKGDCWEDEEYEVSVQCHTCGWHEAAAFEACSATGYIEEVKCKSGSISMKSCPRDTAQETLIFWKFEGAMIVASVIAGAAVMIRMRKLDRENIERIQRQISSL